jgi:aldose 1-epimerase
MYEVAPTQLDGKSFYGAIITDIVTGKRICYEVDETFKYFIVWNDKGTHDYYCPEPMTWMIDAPNLDLPREETGYIELAPKESKSVQEHIFTA